MIEILMRTDMTASIFPDFTMAEPNRIVQLPQYGDSIISLSSSMSSKTGLSKYSISSIPSRKSSVASSMSDHSHPQQQQTGSTKFSMVPKLVKTPWEADRSKRSFQRQWGTAPIPPARPATSPRTLPAHIFQGLPREVYDCIVRQLELLHFSDPSGACLACYLGDLSNLSLTSRAWERAARKKMYGKLYILLDDASTTVRKNKPAPFFMRTKLLRRTLRDRPSLARLTTELHVPGLQRFYQEASINDRASIISTLASLVMAAPNLQKFTGLYLEFDHEYDRLTYALSTRPRLKEHLWILRGIQEEWDETIGYYRTNQRAIRADGSVENADVFLNIHQRWTKLQTLMLFGQGTGSMDYRAFVGTFRAMPALRHLLISSFDEVQFNDRTLAAIPQRLHSLRLQDLPGVSQKGVTRLSESTAICFLRSLSLINLEISSSLTISNFLTNAQMLSRFSLSQSVSPTPPPGNDSLSKEPLYQSNTLKFLHWDVSPFAGPSTGHLASSIEANGFPNLTQLRCPSDDGTLQDLCRPRGHITRPSDSASASALSLSSTLSAARLTAQARLEAARKEPLMQVLVTDEDGELQHKYTMTGFMGKLRSQIEYLLDADVGCYRDGSGIIEVQDIFGKVGGVGSAMKVCEGATGLPVAWNGEKGVWEVKKAKGHRARERTRMVGLDSFF